MLNELASPVERTSAPALAFDAITSDSTMLPRSPAGGVSVVLSVVVALVMWCVQAFRCRRRAGGRGRGRGVHLLLISGCNIPSLFCVSSPPVFSLCVCSSFAVAALFLLALRCTLRARYGFRLSRPLTFLSDLKRPPVRSSLLIHWRQLSFCAMLSRRFSTRFCLVALHSCLCDSRDLDH